MWTLSDAAEHWGLPVALLERAVHAGALGACWAGDRLLVRGEDLDAFVVEDFHAARLAARATERTSQRTGEIAVAPALERRAA